MPRAILETQRFEKMRAGVSFDVGYQKFDNFDRLTLDFYLSGGWHLALNSNLTRILTTISEQAVSGP